MPEEKNLKKNEMIYGTSEDYSEPAETTENCLAKNYFLARMSHEMRTPLNAILGMVTIAQTSDNPGRIAECLSKINDASMHLLVMINDILDMAKIETGNFSLYYTEFNLPEMLRKAADMKKFSLDAKRQELCIELDPALPEIIVSDEYRLNHVLDNLLSNAVKFTPPEGTITLSAKKIKEEGRACTIEIKTSDTGIGISKKNLEKIFAVFEQVDGGTSRKYEGTGLGLPICASIVRLMGGQIRVESEPQKGSSFSFEITVEKSGEAAAGMSNGTPVGEAADSRGVPKYTGKSILIAEDVEINREIVTALLEDSGIIMDCAENGRRAVELYKIAPEKYHAILMDIHMPEMDGYEATRRIRVLEKERVPAAPAGNIRAQVPIIAMTANVFKDDIEKCIAAGMNSHLGKPIDFEELVKQLDRVLL